MNEKLPLSLHKKGAGERSKYETDRNYFIYFNAMFAAAVAGPAMAIFGVFLAPAWCLKAICCQFSVFFYRNKQHSIKKGLKKGNVFYFILIPIL